MAAKGTLAALNTDHADFNEDILSLDGCNSSQPLITLFECHTLSSKIVSKDKNKLDINIVIQIEENDATPVFMELLESSSMKCHIPECQMKETKEKCKDCEIEKTHRSGEIIMEFELTGNSNCVPWDSNRKLKNSGVEPENNKIGENKGAQEDVRDKSTEDSGRAGSKRQRRLPAKLLEGVNSFNKRDQMNLDVDDRKDNFITKKSKANSKTFQTTKDVRQRNQPPQNEIEQIDLESMFKEVKKDWGKSLNTSYDCCICGLSVGFQKQIINHVKKHIRKKKDDIPDPPVSEEKINPDPPVIEEDISDPPVIEKDISDPPVIEKDISDLPVIEKDIHDPPNSKESPDSLQQEIINKTKEDSSDNGIIDNRDIQPELEGRTTETKSQSNKVHVSEKTSKVFVRRNLTRERPFKCTMCDKTYPLKKSLNRHKRMAHKVCGEPESPSKQSCMSAEETELEHIDTSNDEQANTDQTEETDQDDKTEKEEEIGRPHKCSLCHKSYALKSTLKLHELQIHSTNYKFQCPKCDKGFHMISRLQYHIRDFHTEEQITCKVCNKSFRKQNSLADHMKKHNEDSMLKCEICGRKSSSMHHYKLHMRTHTGEKPFQCDECGKFFRSVSNLNMHSRTHKDPQYQCEVCEKKFVTKRTLERHMPIHTGEKKFKCDECGQEFRTQARWKRHELSHKEAPLNCSVCNKGFHFETDLKEHMVFHGERMYKCDMCERSFYTPGSLKRHRETHTERPPEMKKKTKDHVCEKCGKRFDTMAYLKSHYETHNGWRPHKCDICGRIFRSHWYMKVHRNSHTGEKLHQCEKCEEWFINPSYLKIKHPKYCKGKIQPCPVCNRKFTKPKVLKAHLGFHSGQRRFMCNLCGMAFSTNTLLKEHLMRHNSGPAMKCDTCLKTYKSKKQFKKHVLMCRPLTETILPNTLEVGFKVDEASKNKNDKQNNVDVSASNYDAVKNNENISNLINEAIESTDVGKEMKSSDSVEANNFDTVNEAIPDNISEGLGTTVFEIREIIDEGLSTEHIILATIDSSELPEGTTQIILTDPSVLDQQEWKI